MDDQNKVWVDSQEYERLKAAESQASPAIVTGNPASGASVTYNASMPNASTSKEGSSVSRLTIITGVFAVISFIFPPAILVFLGLGVVTITKFFHGHASKGAKITAGAALAVIITIGLVLAAPFLLLIGIIIFWQIGCWSGLGSCTTA